MATCGMRFACCWASCQAMGLYHMAICMRRFAFSLAILVCRFAMPSPLPSPSMPPGSQHISVAASGVPVRCDQLQRNDQCMRKGMLTASCDRQHRVQPKAITCGFDVADACFRPMVARSRGPLRPASLRSAWPGGCAWVCKGPQACYAACTLASLLSMRLSSFSSSSFLWFAVGDPGTTRNHEQHGHQCT